MKRDLLTAAALEAEVKRLREALAPFAAIDPKNPNAWRPEHRVWAYNGNALTLGDFQRAHRVLQETPDET